MIRSLENLTGRLKLIRMAADYQRELAAGRDFWQVMVERYGLTLEVVGGELASIPREGPLVVTANHPYGILDGLMLGHILSQARGDFRILAHRVFRKAAELDRVVLPINFDETREATEENLETRRRGARPISPAAARSGSFPVAPSPPRRSPSGGRWTRPGAASPPG